MNFADAVIRLEGWSIAAWAVHVERQGNHREEPYRGIISSAVLLFVEAERN